jgi:hypothetical protein
VDVQRRAVFAPALYVHNPQPDQSLTRSSALSGYRFLSKRLAAPPAPSDYSDRCIAPLPKRIASSRDLWCGPLSGLSAHISAPVANHPGRGAFGFTSSRFRGFGGREKIDNPAGPAATSTALCDGCTMTGDCRTAPGSHTRHRQAGSRLQIPVCLSLGLRPRHHRLQSICSCRA